MSRIGKKAILLTPKVEVELDSQMIVVKGEKGILSKHITDGFSVEVKEDALYVLSHSNDKKSRALHGLYRALIANMVTGVSQGYKIEIELFGVGYKVQKKGDGLMMALGYSHPVEVKGIEGIQLDISGQNQIIVTGIDKGKVGQVAANIIKLRDAKKDPYKNKGMKRKGVVLRKKAGKKVK